MNDGNSGRSLTSPGRTACFTGKSCTVAGCAGSTQARAQFEVPRSMPTIISVRGLTSVGRPMSVVPHVRDDAGHGAQGGAGARRDVHRSVDAPARSRPRPLVGLGGELWPRVDGDVA